MWNTDVFIVPIFSIKSITAYKRCPLHPQTITTTSWLCAEKQSWILMTCVYWLHDLAAAHASGWFAKRVREGRMAVSGGQSSGLHCLHPTTPQGHAGRISLWTVQPRAFLAVHLRSLGFHHILLGLLHSLIRKPPVASEDPAGDLLANRSRYSS